MGLLLLGMWQALYQASTSLGDIMGQHLGESTVNREGDQKTAHLGSLENGASPIEGCASSDHRLPSGSCFLKAVAHHMATLCSESLLHELLGYTLNYIQTILASSENLTQNLEMGPSKQKI